MCDVSGYGLHIILNKKDEEFACITSGQGENQKEKKEEKMRPGIMPYSWYIIPDMPTLISHYQAVCLL